MASDRESTRPGSSGTATANSSVLEPRAQKAEQDDQQPQPPTDADGDLAPVTTSHSRVFMGADGKPQFKPSRDFYLAFLSLATIVLAVAFDATSLSVALPDMSFDLGGTALEAFWAGTSFLLASTVFQPTVAGLSNIFGRKYLIYVESFFFGAGSLIAALADNFTVILVGRTIQGVGGGGLIALTEVVVTDLVPLQWRGQYFSILSAMWSVGTVTGPLIGAGFAQNVTWRWIFYINLPVIGLGVFFVVLFLNQMKIPGHLREKLARFDYIGSLLFTITSTAFLFGITTGGVMYSWSSWRVILPIVIGALGMAGFLWYEFRFAKEPIIDKGIFNNYTMILSYIMTIFHGMILWTLLYFLVLYYQGVKLYSPVTSGVAFLPESLTVAPAGMVVGIIASLTGHYRWSLWAGWVLTTMGSGILYLLDRDTTVPQWIFLNIPVGIGTGMLFPAMALSIQAACIPGLNSQAAAFFSFLRTFGQSIGVAVAGVIFQNSFHDKLSAIPALAPFADEFSRDATAVVHVIKGMPDGPERTTLMVAYNDALRTIWLASIGFSAFGLALSAFVRSYSLQQEHITEQGLVESKKKGPDVEAGGVSGEK